MTLRAAEAGQVARRRVFYIPGYDPFHPRRYRELYRKEAVRQAAISGFEVALSPGASKAAYGWHVAAEIEGARSEADVEVLVWSDIVRDSMSGSIPATYGQLLRTAWVYISTGALFRLMRLRKGPVIAGFYPVAMLLAQLALAIAAGLLVLGAVARLWAAGGAPEGWGALAGAVPGALAGWSLLRWFRARDGKLFAYYLMHDLAFSARRRGANPPALEARIAAFADRIADALEEGADEVLVVGHSSGAQLAVSALADVIRRGRVAKGGPALSFLSLGQVIPMISFLPEAHQLRADLSFLSTRDEITWVDVSAPGDGCAFALCDPVAVSGVAPPAKRWPLVISAAFTRTLSPARWKALRWRFFRLHFQYLCAFDRPGDYDYFRITAGPKTLGARFAGRQPSRSRIERAVSGYRGRAA